MSLSLIAAAIEAVADSQKAVLAHIERKRRIDQLLLEALQERRHMEEHMSQAVDSLNAAVTALEAAVTAHKAEQIDPAAIDTATTRINAAVAALQAAPAAPPAG